MKRSARAIALAAAVVVACSAPTTQERAAPTNAGPQGAPSGALAQGAPVARALDVRITPDNSLAASDEIGPEGGTIDALAPDGTRFVLEIPSGALTEKKRISVTPVKAIDSFPFSKGLVGAVQLEPDGLELAVPAVLTIEPASPVALVEREGFAYYGSGKDFHMYPIENEGDRLRMKLLHFSGHGEGRATPADRKSQGKRIPNSPEAQLWQRVAQILGMAREKALLGIDDNETYAEVVAALEAALRATIARAAATCNLQTLMILEHTAQILGVDFFGRHGPNPFGVSAPTVVVFDKEFQEVEEKCGRLSLEVDSRIVDEKSSRPAWRHEAHAVLKSVIARPDETQPAGLYRDLVGTGYFDVTFTATGFPCTGTQHLTDVPASVRIVGGLASPSPTLVLSFDWINYSDTRSPLHMFAECSDDSGTPMPPATGSEMWRAMLFDLHEDEAVETQDSFGEGLRVTGWTHIGDGPARSWRKSYMRTTEGRTGFGDSFTRIESTTIELRRKKVDPMDVNIGPAKEVDSPDLKIGPAKEVDSPDLKIGPAKEVDPLDLQIGPPTEVDPLDIQIGPVEEKN